MTYVQPHLIQAHANLISAPHSSKQRETNAADVTIAALNAMGRRNPATATGSAAGTTAANAKSVDTPLRPITRSSTSAGTSGYTPADIKITGYSENFRPDDQSVWDAYSHQWKREWLPGEKDAEALDRMLEVKDSYAARAEDRSNDYLMQRGQRDVANEIESYAGKRAVDSQMLTKMEEQYERILKVASETAGLKKRDPDQVIVSPSQSQSANQSQPAQASLSAYSDQQQSQQPVNSEYSTIDDIGDVLGSGLI